MTVVDSRGRRTPADAKGRTFSGPPARRPAPRPSTQAQTTTEVRAPRRPGALAIWLFAVVGCAIGVGAGAAQHETGYHSASIAYVVAAPIAAGLVRRGRDLTLLVLCLPLALAGAICAAAAFVLSQDDYPVTTRGVLQELGQELVLHPAALWGGTALAVIVALRRGLGRRT